MTDSTTVRVQRVLPATPDVVFDQWVDPEALADWMCPRPARCTAVTVDPRVGGIVRLDVDDTGQSVLITGQFLAVDRPTALRFTWSASDWPDPTVVSVVDVSFEPVGDDQTLMSVEHSLLPAQEWRDYNDGWVTTVEQFAARLHG